MEPREKFLEKSTEEKPLSSPKVIEFVPRFNQTQEDLLYLFNIKVTSPASLNYDWVKKEFLEKVKEEIKLGTPFALDYMFEEKLLTKEDLKVLRSSELQPYIATILKTYRGTRLERAKNLFIDAGICTEKEVEEILNNKNLL